MRGAFAALPPLVDIADLLALPGGPLGDPPPAQPGGAAEMVLGEPRELITVRPFAPADANRRRSSRNSRTTA
jgi:hypothetical protein